MADAVVRGVDVVETWLLSAVSCLANEGGVEAFGVVGPPSKSHSTPCFKQFPQAGCTSSH